MADREYLIAPWIRVWHWTNALLIITLGVTGLSVHFADPSLPLVDFALAVRIHNTAGVLLIAAYLFFVVEAMIDAGVMLGLPRDISTTLVNQTMFGSAKLLIESGQHPTVLREQVTSPGGTTAAALRQLEDHRVKAAFITAMEAARDRSRALAGPAT